MSAWGKLLAPITVPSGRVALGMGRHDLGHAVGDPARSDLRHDPVARRWARDGPDRGRFEHRDHL